MNGRKPSTPRLANSNGVAWSDFAARIGTASPEICVPNSLIVWPVHSFMKSRCDQSRPDGLRILVSPIHRHREAVRLAGGVLGVAELHQQLVQPSVEALRVCSVQAYADHA